jgi:polysaccharide pyruvyl transferase WcaK-like protein
MKILIINSDSPNNRGDRAILQGNLQLIKNTWPEADVWALSEYKVRDEAWYGINFLPYSAYTANPLNLLRIAYFSRSCDYVFWGGGEILKDYTNKLGIIYWLMRMFMVRMCNSNIIGTFQGIGPTSATSSKKMIVRAVALTKLFIVRDQESRQKLENWGSKTPIISSYDPAIMNTPQPLDDHTKAILLQHYDIDLKFLDNAIGVGLRRWFHYKKGGLVPYKLRFWEKTPTNASNPKLEAYAKNVALLLDNIVETHDINVVFFPMFNAPPEGDDIFSLSVAAQMKHANRTRIIEEDDLSPQQYQNVVARCKLFIAARLHSSIIAVSSGVPAIVFYYVDKGRLFFEQIGMQRYSQPIETLLEQKNLTSVEQQVADILKNTVAVTQEIESANHVMRTKISTDFSNAISQVKS